MASEMRPKHTPGPWNDGIYHATKSGGRLIAYIRGPNTIVPLAAVPIEVDGYGREEGEANCRLMTAAPEMIEALRAIKKARGNCGASPFEQAACDLMDAAIAKAEGRSNG